MVRIKSSVVNIKMMFLRSFAFPFLKEDAVGMHLVSSQPPTITLCNADLYNAWRLFTVSPSLPFSLSLPSSRSKNGRTFACRKLKVRDVTSGAVGLPRNPCRNFILTNRDERKPRDLMDTSSLALLIPPLRVHAFFSHHAFRDAATHPLRSDIEFPIKFPLSLPIATLLPRSPPVDSCYFAATIRPL